MLPRQSDRSWSNDEMLKKLRCLLAAKGRLSETLIRKARGMPGSTTLHKHFGSYRQMYEMIGYRPPYLDIFKGEEAERTLRLRREIVRRITELFPDKVFASRLPGRSRSILQLTDGPLVSILMCRMVRKRKNGGRLHWLVTPNPAERDCITLLGKVSQARERVCSYYLFPKIEVKFRRSYERDPWLSGAIRLNELSEFYRAVEEILHSSAGYRDLV
jgi:hypothetical protein